MKASHRVILAASALLGVAPSVALAIPSATYSGRTGQRAKISFRASPTTVSKLKTTVTVSCLGAYPVLKHELVVVPIAPKTSAKLHNGGFTFTIPAPVSHKPGKNERTVVTGKIHGHSASGSIKTLFGKTWLVTDPSTGSATIEIGSCAAKTSWSATSQGVVRAASSSAVRPCIAPESNRRHLFRIDLDGDGHKERILVYNFDAAASPVSMFLVCKRVRGEWVAVQRQTILQSPGARSSGLVNAWAGDLNKDRRVEIAARDFMTPSAGEVLSIYRQTKVHSLRFSKLQSMGADQVTLHPRARTAATVTVLLRPNHSVDGRRHLQIWRWSSTADRWTCRSGCRGFPAARQGGSVRASAAATCGAIVIKFGTIAYDVHTSNISCATTRSTLRSRTWPRGWSCRIVSQFGRTYARRRCTKGSQVIIFTSGIKPWWR